MLAYERSWCVLQLAHHQVPLHTSGSLPRLCEYITKSIQACLWSLGGNQLKDTLEEEIRPQINQGRVFVVPGKEMLFLWRYLVFTVNSNGV